jgi:hypothetical protein
MPSAIDDGAPSSDLLLAPPSPQRHAGTLQVLPLASPSRAGAILSGIGSAVAGVIQAFSPPRAPPSELIGTSPFDLSLVDSTISTTMNEDASSSVANSGVGQKETDANILQLMANDLEEEGDGGDSDVEGGEVDLHHNVIPPATRRIDEHFCSIDNEIDIDEWGEQFTPPIPSAPDGWIPPGVPINFLGYVPKLDAPLIFDNVDNPAGWDQFVFQAKYAVEKGKKGPKKYVGHTTPAGALVVPANDDGIQEING